MRLITVILAGLLAAGAATQAAAQMPTPVLEFAGAEYYQAGGKTWVRYKLRVVNWAGYGAAVFHLNGCSHGFLHGQTRPLSGRERGSRS